MVQAGVRPYKMAGAAADRPGDLAALLLLHQLPGRILCAALPSILADILIHRVSRRC